MTRPKITVEYVDPKTGALRKRRMRGQVEDSDRSIDLIWDRWNDRRDGRLVSISEGWQ